MCRCLHMCMCTHAHACICSGRKSKTPSFLKSLLSRNNCTNSESAPVLREETRRGASADCSLHPAWDTAMLLQCTMADRHSLVPAPLPTFLVCKLCTACTLLEDTAQDHSRPVGYTLFFLIALLPCLRVGELQRPLRCHSRRDPRKSIAKSFPFVGLETQDLRIARAPSRSLDQ